MDHQSLHDLLTPAEEATLARAIEAGVVAQHALDTGWRPCDATTADLLSVAQTGRDAWDRFILANLGLVHVVARMESRRSGVDEEDLAQEGFVALALALRRFDHTRGRFSTYALPRVRHQIAQAAASRLGNLGLPTSVAVLRRRLVAVAGRLDQQHQRHASVADVSAEIGRPASWTSRVLGHTAPLSLQDSTGHVHDMAAPPVTSPDPVDPARLAHCLTMLPSTQGDVLRLRFGFDGEPPLSYAAAAARLGTNASSVRRTEQRGLASLRRFLDAID